MTRVVFSRSALRTTYAKVAGKYQDVLTLEQSVAELHQMFLDFALLTEQQGELLDQIEFQVKQANDYVEEGNVELVEAIVYQKAIRKKQWYVAKRMMTMVEVKGANDCFFFVPKYDHRHCGCMCGCIAVRYRNSSIIWDGFIDVSPLPLLFL